MNSCKPMLKRALLALVVAGTLGGATTATAAEHTVTMQGKAFAPAKLQVKVGDTVKFVNADPYSHNVFSLSNAKSFDLGTYPQGVAKSVTFDAPGTVEIECAVHPDMKLTIEVSK